MNEVGEESTAQKIGVIAGVLAALLILRRLRKRRKEKKLLKKRAKAKAKLKARQIDQRVKDEKARVKVDKKSGKKAEKSGKGKKSKKSKKDRSVAEQLLRFAILAAGKKIISQQIELAGKELGSSGKLGKKIASTT